MPVINDLIDDLVDEDEVLPDALFIEDPTEVSEDFHHPVEDVHHVGGGHVVLGGCHKEYSKLLCVEVIDPIHVLQHQSLVHEGGGYYKAWRRIALPELDLSKEYLTGLPAKVQTD